MSRRDGRCLPKALTNKSSIKGLRRTGPTSFYLGTDPDLVSDPVPDPASDNDALLSPENRFGCGRYPLRVRTLYFFNWSPTSFTVIARQPVLALGFG